MNTKITNVTPDNVLNETLFCIKDIKKPEFKAKQKWFEKRYEEGLQLKILKDETDKMLGYIEYIPAVDAWRPVNAPTFMFIHCMYIYSKKDRNLGLGSKLINEAEKDAKEKNMDGLCVMTSKGSWMADKRIFKRLDFDEVDKRGRFELCSKTWNPEAAPPKLFDWTAQQKKYKGWHLLYADQCPWHEKSVEAMLNTAMDFEIDLNITKIETAQEAQQAPSGFGVFSLLHDGELLEDHYLSATRFRNILKAQIS
ncbi:GNAT family N-acetyltransferase [Flavivirga eckloniae]|uniref:N-acetyltransferase domain-containing protein n=1 Tax=Flavivirga eckloniae TaxID=1803846 RepID=A0A2K9PW79_9FLAO|nr:GNAT family N-acetyltransferase [Flavivirga eckloniae]AUP81325.1 hypothetical protein C1H87_22430 [Flavivirga eckloniae]